MSGIAQSLGPLKLLKGQRTPGRPDAQAAGSADVQEPGSLNTQTSGRPGVQAAAPSPLPLQGTAKRSHPDFSKRTIYVRDRTHRAALRKWEDAGRTEFSDLVEELLQAYVAGRLDV